MIDTVLSVDKRKLNADQFGYKSLHLIASFDKSREKLPEYSRFKNIKFEIQIRSILQYAWAEIEHNLGYKGIVTIPETAKRTFNRLSALLEITDIEFDRLKKEIKEYELNVGELISSEPENVLIDQASLVSVINSNQILLEARKIISQNLQCTFYEDVDYQYYINILINYFHINTIEKLNKKLILHKTVYLKFADEFSKKSSVKKEILPITLNLFCFFHFLSAIDENIDFAKKYLKFGNINTNENNDRFIQIIKKIKK